MEERMKKLIPAKWRSNFPSTKPQPSSSDTETPEIVDADEHHQQSKPANHNPEPSGVDVPALINQQMKPANDNPEPSGVDIPAHSVKYWSEKVIGFCLSWAAAIALLSLQIHGPLPLSFHFPSLTIVIALSLFFVSKYMYPNDPKLAQLLENVGVLFGFTAFFFAITIPYPLWIKLVYWTIYALSLLVIFLCNRKLFTIFSRF